MSLGVNVGLVWFMEKEDYKRCWGISNSFDTLVVRGWNE